MQNNNLTILFMLIGMLNFLYSIGNVINMLISIEVMFLALLFSMSWLGGYLLANNWSFFIMLFVVVCDSVLGLSMMVSMSRSNYVDNLSFTNSFMW